MSGLGTLEGAVVSGLGSLEVGGGVLLATARAVMAADRKTLLAGLARERTPAAHVVLDGLDAGKSDGGAVMVRVLVATRSHRDGDEARSGGPEGPGLLEVCEVIARALSAPATIGGCVLAPAGEEFEAGADGLAVAVLRYRATLVTGSQPVTFGGVAVAGSRSEVRVERVSVRRGITLFGFPGIGGVFGQDTGMGERVLAWVGKLRGEDAPALDGLEAGLEALLGGGAATMVDEGGQVHAGCVARSFDRHGARLKDAWTGELVQGFRMEFVQLGA